MVLKKEQAAVAAAEKNVNWPNYLPVFGWLKSRDILGDPNASPPIPPLVPVGKTAWWAGIERGWYPPPHRFGRGVTFWSASDIRRLVETGDWRNPGDENPAMVAGTEVPE